MKSLDIQRQTVFYVALAQQTQPLLVSSKYYYYATRTISLCWSWIERHDVPGMTLYDLFHDDDDYGVETAMYAEQDPVRWNAWGCMALALANVGFHAFEAEGTPPPETFENAFPDEILAEFLGYYQGALGESRVPELLAAFLQAIPDDQLTEAVVRAKLSGPEPLK